jgi:UDP-glucose 4-epimerase
MSPTKVLITGAAGFIGSHLTEACLARGWHVTAIDSLTTYYSPAAKVANTRSFAHHERCRYLEQDLLDLDLPALVCDVDHVFHLAAQAGVRASWGSSFSAYTQLNVTVLQRLLELRTGPEELRLRVVVVRLRRRGADADDRGSDPAPAVAIRRHEGARRKP